MWNIENSAQIIYLEFETITEVLYFYTENPLYLFRFLAFFIL
jgi:hypothetical protein